MALSTLNSKDEEKEEAMYGSDNEIAENDMELQHSEISDIANFFIGTHDVEDLFVPTVSLTRLNLSASCGGKCLN